MSEQGHGYRHLCISKCRCIIDNTNDDDNNNNPFIIIITDYFLLIKLYKIDIDCVEISHLIYKLRKKTIYIRYQKHNPRQYGANRSMQVSAST